MAKQQLLRIDEVISRTTLSKRTIYRKIKEGTFPKQRRITGKSVAWLECEIDDWIIFRPESDMVE